MTTSNLLVLTMTKMIETSNKVLKSFAICKMFIKVSIPSSDQGIIKFKSLKVFKYKDNNTNRVIMYSFNSKRSKLK